MNETESTADSEDMIEIRCGISIDYNEAPLDNEQATALLKPGEATSERVKYEALVIRVLHTMDYLKYEAITEYTHDGDKDDDGSMYFAFKQDRTVQGRKARFIVFLRIADHPFGKISAELQPAEYLNAMKYKTYGLQNGDKVYSPIKANASKRGNCRDAIKSLTCRVKEFTADTAL